MGNYLDGIVHALFSALSDLLCSLCTGLGKNCSFFKCACVKMCVCNTSVRFG